MPPVSGRALWFGLWGAPAAWSVQLVVDYPLAARACFPHRTPLPHPGGVGLHGITALVGITSLVALLGLLVSLAAMAVAARSWRQSRDRSAGDGAISDDALEQDRMGAQPRARVRFMAAAGLMTSTLFAFGVILTGVSPALVSACW
jgi:hypothetical protein